VTRRDVTRLSVGHDLVHSQHFSRVGSSRIAINWSVGDYDPVLEALGKSETGTGGTRVGVA
jgi:hypothetical protein